MSGSGQSRWERKFWDKWYPIMSRRSTKLLLLERRVERMESALKQLKFSIHRWAEDAITMHDEQKARRLEGDLGIIENALAANDN